MSAANNQHRSPLPLILVLAAGLSACSLTDSIIFGNTDAGATLGDGAQATLHFFTRDAWYDTGIDLQAGARYQLDVAILSHWVDGRLERNENDQPLDERGFDNSLMRWSWFGALRRSREHRWFELMLYQPACRRASLRGVSDLEVDPENRAYLFTATCNGKLTLFVNDSHGFYDNNVGYANLSLSRVD